MERPAFISAFGILNIAFAAAHLAKLLLYIPTRAHALSRQSAFTQKLLEHPFLAFWSVWAIPLALLSIVLLLVTGIGLLMLKEWARKLAIAYGIYATLASASVAIGNFVCIFGPMVEKSASLHGFAGTMLRTIVTGFAIGSISQLIYPALLFAFMTRPDAAAAFRSPPHPPALPPL